MLTLFPKKFHSLTPPLRDKLLSMHLKKYTHIPESDPIIFPVDLFTPMSQIAVAMIAQVLGL